MPRTNATSLAHATAVKLLEDGKWHDFAKVRLAVSRAIPPGEALRLAKRRLTTPFNPRDKHQQEFFIRSGQKFLSMQILSEKSRFERKGKLIRMLPYTEVTFEQYSEAAKRANAAQTAQQRRARARKASETLGAEGRSERSRRGWAAISPEQRTTRARKINASVTPAVRSAMTKKALAKKTPEWLSERSKKAWATRRQRSEPPGE